jgi:hypothetical protein
MTETVWWTREQDERLRALAAQVPAISYSEIARQMRTTKNAVVGRVHRLGLPARPAAVAVVDRFTDEQRAEIKHLWCNTSRTEREIAERLETTQGRLSYAIRKMGLPMRTAGLPGGQVHHPRSRFAVLPVRREALPVRAKASPHRQCQWIEGQQRPALFCGAPVARPGCSWCATHAARVFTVQEAA